MESSANTLHRDLRSPTMKALVWSVAVAPDGCTRLRKAVTGGGRRGVAGWVIAGPASAAGAVVLPTPGDRTKELGACS